MRAGLSLSVLLHAGVALSGFLYFPYAARTFDSAPVIPIDLVTIAERTNIRAAAPKEEEPEEQEPEERQPEPEPEPPAPAPATEAPPPPAPPPEPEPQEAEEAPAPQPEAAKPEAPSVKPRAKPEAKRADLNLDALAALVDKSRKDQPANEADGEFEAGDTWRAAAGEGTAMTVSELDALRAQMERCWRAPLDAPNPEKIRVRVRAQFNPDGTLARRPDLLDSARILLSGDPYLQVAAERAVRAVIQCAPYTMPADKYALWSDVTVNFSAADMLGR